jgi:hypothetical protein
MPKKNKKSRTKVPAKETETPTKVPAKETETQLKVPEKETELQLKVPEKEPGGKAAESPAANSASESDTDTEGGQGTGAKMMKPKKDFLGLEKSLQNTRASLAELSGVALEHSEKLISTLQEELQMKKQVYKVQMDRYLYQKHHPLFILRVREVAFHEHKIKQLECKVSGSNYLRFQNEREGILKERHAELQKEDAVKKQQAAENRKRGALQGAATRKAKKQAGSGLGESSSSSSSSSSS